MATETRAIRNNNPMNIERGSSEWRGRMPREKMTAMQAAETRFEVFESPEYGIRAATIILRTYMARGLDTPIEIISRWAPPSDNNPTAEYAKAVADALGVAVDDEIDTSDPQTLLAMFKAMIKIEAGSQPYTDDQIMGGILLALNPRPVAPPSNPVKDKVAGLARHAATFAAGVAFLAAAGLISQEDATALGEAGKTLLTQENMEAVGVVLGIAAGILATVRSWVTKSAAARKQEDFAS